MNRRLLDVALAVGTLLVFLIAVWADLRTDDDRPADPLAYVVVLAISALLLLRRRWPVAVLAGTCLGVVLYHALHYPPIGIALPMAAALFSVAEAGRWRVGALTAAGFVVATWTYRLAAGQDPRHLFAAELPQTVAIIAAALALGEAVRAHRLLAAQQARAVAAARREEEQAAAARIESERLAVARDVHDVLGHTVSVVSLHTAVAREAVEDDDKPAALRAIDAANAAAGRALADLRGTVRALRGAGDALSANDQAGRDRPHESGPAPGLDGVAGLSEQARAAGLQVETRLNVLADDVPAAASAAAYRIVQESLTNVLRHADARQVHVQVGVEGHGIRVQISDDGRGLGRAREGAGRRGMRERAELLGGRVRVGARENSSGTEVDAWIPC